MKIRNGFVSNSSSSSFVIAITRDFEISDEVAQKILDTYDNYYFKKTKEPKTIEDIKNILRNTIDKLCTDRGILYQCESYPLLARDLLRVCGDEIEITSIDSGPDEGRIINCLADRYKDNVLLKFKKIIEKNV